MKTAWWLKVGKIDSLIIDSKFILSDFIFVFYFKVLCYNYWESNIEACLNDPKTLQLDVQKCWRLDFSGQPISEYNVVDNYITCVGYWMEDTKSFLVTYDKEDPVSLIPLNSSALFIVDNQNGAEITKFHI